MYVNACMYVCLYIRILTHWNKHLAIKDTNKIDSVNRLCLRYTCQLDVRVGQDLGTEIQVDLFYNLDAHSSLCVYLFVLTHIFVNVREHCRFLTWAVFLDASLNYSGAGYQQATRAGPWLFSCSQDSDTRFCRYLRGERREQEERVGVSKLLYGSRDLRQIPRSKIYSWVFHVDHQWAMGVTNRSRKFTGEDQIFCCSKITVATLCSCQVHAIIWEKTLAIRGSAHQAKSGDKLSCTPTHCSGYFQRMAGLSRKQHTEWACIPFSVLERCHRHSDSLGDSWAPAEERGLKILVF